VDILFSTTKHEKLCNNDKKLAKKHGQRQAEIIRRRLDDLRAAASLKDLRNAPGRCHELSGDRKGQLSLDLVHPYRLLFTPANDPMPTKDDGGLDWGAVTAVEILEVEDTHG
jgi:proteic killer suppression protein